MRLLNVHTLELKDFTGREVPDYSILSHRWGKDEVSYKEFRKRLNQDSAGYQKIVDFCAFISRRYEKHSTIGTDSTTERIDWAWIDTCKSELPERTYYTAVTREYADV